MNLIIDIGNTFIKMSVFGMEEVKTETIAGELHPSDIGKFLKEFAGVESVIVSAVRNYSNDLREYFKRNFRFFLELNDKTPLPVKNNYKTKETLGNDRIAAVVGANYLYPGKNVLVVDAGTAITYDFIDENGEYAGGNISPGIEMRFKALNRFTGRLPLVRKKNLDKLVGQTTEEAILAGVMQGVVFEVEGTIRAFKEIYKNLIVIITGGDAIFFDNKLKNYFFVHFNLIAIGLNRILEYNGCN